jgi:hypothetical protein
MAVSERDGSDTWRLTLKAGIRASVAAWFPSNNSTLELVLGLMGELLAVAIALVFAAHFPVFLWIALVIALLRAPFEIRVLWWRWMHRTLR